MTTALIAMGLALPGAAMATGRRALGLFEGWGAFADRSPHRCFAIAEPSARRADAAGRPYATVAIRPGRQAGMQVHFRLRAVRQPKSPVLLALGDRKWRLAGGVRDAWAVTPRDDAAIIAAMRGGALLWITAQRADGRFFTDRYALAGAASAIDAAALACVRPR